MPRRDFSKVAFAATGDTNSIPTPTQPDGSVSLQQGFTFDYQRDNGAGGGTPDPLAKNIDREDMNGILNEITASVGEIQQNGLPIWISTAAPYPINASVRHNNTVWQSVVANNSDTPGSTANWKDISAAPSGRLLNVRVYSSGATPYVPTPGTVTCIGRVQGGGGGGGGAAATVAGASAAGSGGGAGGYAVSRVPVATFSGLTVTVGSGGAPQANGGASSIGTVLSATGGNAGAAGNATTSYPTQSAGSLAGVGSGGNILNSVGGSGGAMLLTTPGNGLSGEGGQSALSAGGRRATGSNLGIIGSNGSGGSGGISQSNPGGGFPGGVGGTGLVIIEEYT